MTETQPEARWSSARILMLLVGAAMLPLLNGYLRRNHLVGDLVRMLLIGLVGGIVCALVLATAERGSRPSGRRVVMLALAAGAIAALASLADELLRA